ncbi:MAG: hypothetical protein ACKORB_09205, partial [Opitutia bacterium]
GLEVALEGRDGVLERPGLGVHGLVQEGHQEAARMAASGFADLGRPDEVLSSANAILRAFHQRHIQGRQRTLAARIAALGPDDEEGLRALQTEKIALRKEGAAPPTLTLPA